MNTLKTFWLSTLTTFLLIYGIIIPYEDYINVPGELQESILSAGFLLLIPLLFLSFISYHIEQRSSLEASIFLRNSLLSICIAVVVFLIGSDLFAVECIDVPPGGIQEG